MEATPAQVNGVELEIVKVQVNALRSTDRTQYYYEDERTFGHNGAKMTTRYNLTLLWPSDLPHWFVCQREDGKQVTLRYDAIKLESKGVEAKKDSQSQQNAS